MHTHRVSDSLWACLPAVARQMRLRPLPELATNKTGYQNFRVHVLIICLRVVVFIAIHLSGSGDEHFLNDPLMCLSLAAMRTALSHKIFSRALKENDNAPSALYPYWRMRVDAFCFRIVVQVGIYFLRLLDKLRCRFHGDWLQFCFVTIKKSILRDDCKRISHQI